VKQIQSLRDYWQGHPDRLILAAKNCANLVCLKLGNGESRHCGIIEPTTRVGGLFEPAIDGIPADSLYSSNCGFVQAFDAEAGDLVKGCATMLEPIVGRAHIQAEGLPANPAPISATLSPSGFVEAVADEVSGTGFPRQWALRVRTSETLHGSWILSTIELMDWN
jgi:hypothetical protein